MALKDALISGKRGASVPGYALMIALVVLVALISVSSLGSQIVALFGGIGVQLAGGPGKPTRNGIPEDIIVDTCGSDSNATFDDISEALAALGPGDTLILAPCVYDGLDFVIDQPNVTVRGNKAATLINGSPYGIEVEADGVTIDGLVIESSSQAGIRVEDADNVTVTNNIIRNNSTDGIVLRSASRNLNYTVTDNEIRDNAQTGLIVSANGSTTVNITATDNTIENNPNDGVVFDSTSNASLDMNFSNNDVLGNGRFQFRLRVTSATASASGSITNNRIEQTRGGPLPANASHGIALETDGNLGTAGSPFTISGNSSSFNGNRGVSFGGGGTGISHMLLSGNLFHENVESAFTVLASNSHQVNFTFTNHPVDNEANPTTGIVRSGKRALQFQASQLAVINGTVSNNHLIDTQSSNAVLVRPTGAAGSEINVDFLDNRIVGSTSNGLFFQNIVNSATVTSTIRGNEILDHPNSGLFIDCDSSDGNAATTQFTEATIEDNTLSGNRFGMRLFAEEGCTLTASAAGNVIHSNTQQELVIHDRSAEPVFVDLSSGAANAFVMTSGEEVDVEDDDGSSTPASGNWWTTAGGSGAFNSGLASPTTPSLLNSGSPAASAPAGTP
ncbi:MAG: hypothetical protein Alpg2KO_03730 [Alphaproteobacteria bacterium]